MGNRPFLIALVWAAIACTIFAAIAAVFNSPLLEWRNPVYIAAGVAGVLALCILLVQPLLPNGRILGLSPKLGRRIHFGFGVALVLAVLVHVTGLWLTSPPDMIDALLFRSPTPFSAWGVIAMWAIFASAVVAICRHRISVRAWRLGHTCLGIVIVISSIVHTIQIEGTMGTISKIVLCVLVIAATAKTIIGLRLWVLIKSPRK